MNDFEQLKEIFEMAEILTSEEQGLQIEVVDENNGSVRTVSFAFCDGDLMDVVIEVGC